MEELFNKIIDYLVSKLRNGEYNLSMRDIANEFDVPDETLKKIVPISNLPNFLLKLSNSPTAQKKFEEFRKDPDYFRKKYEGKDFTVTQERIREIEAKVLKKMKNNNDDPPDDIA